MRSAARRKIKYKAKVRGLVLPGQAARYAPTAADRIHLEQCVKTANITPMLQFSYVAFCEELLKHEASKRPEEAQGIYRKWLNRGLVQATLVSVARCIGVEIPVVVCDWGYKMKLTFTGNVSATDLDDFPVLVHLDSGNFNFAHAKTNGEDIRFMDTDICPSEGTPLKHEIESWDQAGEDAWVWVKVPRIDGGSVTDFIYMYFDNAAAADGQDAVNVWTNGYRMVQHMYDNPDNTKILGSTTNAEVGTKAAAGAPLDAASQIWRGQLFDGTDDHILLDAGLLPQNNFTVSAWARKTSDTATKRMIIQLFGDRYFFLYMENQVLAPDVACTRTESGAAGTWLQVGLTAAEGWRHFHVVKSSVTGFIFYKSGVQVAIDAALTGNVDAKTENNRIGRNYDDLDPANGRIDEVRISTVVRTPDWILADFKSQNDTLITYGAEEGS